MNPENHNPKPLEDIVPEVVQEIVERQQQAIDSARVWGTGETLIDAINNLQMAKDEDKGDIISGEIIKAAELRLEAARREVFQEPREL